MAESPNQNPKAPAKEKSTDDSDVASNNPVKKRDTERRDQREDPEHVNQNLGSQKYRESKVETGRIDRSAR